MIIKSNAHRRYIAGIIGEFVCLCAGIVLGMEGKELIGWVFCYFLILYMFVSTWFCNGKTIIMDAEGCEVCFWKFRRKYFWNELNNIGRMVMTLKEVLFFAKKKLEK